MGRFADKRPWDLVPRAVKVRLSDRGRSALEAMDFQKVPGALGTLSRSAPVGAGEGKGDGGGGGTEDRVLCALLLQYTGSEAVRRGLMEERQIDQYLMRLLKDDAQEVWAAASRVWGDLCLRGDNKWRRWLLRTIFHTVFDDPLAVAQLARNRTFRAVQIADLGSFKRVERRAYVALGEVFRRNAALELPVFYPDREGEVKGGWKISTVTSRDLFFYLLDKKRVSSVVKSKLYMPRIDPHAIGTAFLAIRFFDRPRIIFDNEIKNALASDRPETMRSIFGIFNETRETINIPLMLKKMEASRHKTYKGAVDWVTLKEADDLAVDCLVNIYPRLPGERRDDVIGALTPFVSDMEARYSLRAGCSAGLFSFMLGEEDEGRRGVLRDLTAPFTGYDTGTGSGDSAGTGGGGGADGGRGGRAGPAAGDADIVLPTLADQVRTLLDRALVSKTAITFFIHPSKGMTPGLRKQVLLNRHVNTGAVRFLKNRNFLPRDEGAIDSYCMELIKERADLIDGCLTLMAAERWRQLEVGDKGQLLTLLHDLCEETYEAEHFRGVVREDARKRIEEFIDAWLSPERVIDQLVGLVDRGFTEDEPVIFKEGVRLLKSLLDSSASVRIAGFDTVTPLFGWLKRLEPGRYGALLDDVAIIIERSLDQMGMDGRGGDAAVFCVHRLIEEGAASVLLDRVAARARDPEIGEVLESYRDMMPSIMEVVN